MVKSIHLFDHVFVLVFLMRNHRTLWKAKTFSRNLFLSFVTIILVVPRDQLNKALVNFYIFHYIIRVNFKFSASFF